MMTKPVLDPGGDEKIDVHARAYSLAEIAVLSNVSAMSVRNWLVRVRMNVGQKSWAGRWRFSLLDGLRLSVLQAICVRADLVELEDGAKIAEAVVEEALKFLRQPPSGQRENFNVLVGWNEQGEIVVGSFRSLQPHLGHHWPPRATHDGDYQPLRAPYLVLPASAMVSDLMLRTDQIAKQAQREEGPAHV
jgi:hypothetical protein